MASSKTGNLKDTVVDGLAGGVKSYLPSMNNPACRQCGWLSAGQMTAVTVLTLTGLDQKGVHIISEIPFVASSGA